MSERDDDPKPTTSAATAGRPSRRLFVAMLGGAAVAIVVPKVAPEKSPRSTWSGKTRWIGHC
jgi:hypothetical protein